MKKIILLILSLSLILISCNKDFLEIQDPNAITSDQCWKSPADAQLAVVAMYSTLLLEGTYRQWYPYVFETRSDLGYSELAWREMALFPKFIESNYNWLNECWGDNFKGISRCNQILLNVPNISMDNQLKQRYLAEAKYFRGLFYFNLVLLYGRPPIILTPSVTGQETPSNATPEQVYDQIISDMKAAISGLPWTVPTEELGRVTKGAAYGMIGKTYLLKHDFNNAKNAFDTIIKSGQFQLVANYFDNFRHDTEFNSESIFEVCFSTANNTDFWAKYTPEMATVDRSSNYLAPSDIRVGGTSDANPNLFYMYEFTDTTATGKIDPRRNLSILCDTSQIWYNLTFKQLGGSAVGINPKIWYKKYTNGYWKTNEIVGSGINRRIIRYADILLMYAECLNELGQTNEAIDYIDMVRKRAGVMTLKDQGILFTKETMRQQIEHERIVELGGESIRWFDLMRWGYLDDPAKVAVLKTHDYEFTTKPFRPGEDKYLPIPQMDMDLNPNFTQNPGW